MSSDSVQQDPKKYDLDEFKPKDASVDKSTVLGDGTVTTEQGQIPWNTYGKSLETLVQYRNSINPESVRDMAKDWRTHGNALKSLAAQFSNQVNSKIIDSWDSDAGRSAAAPAVQRYAEQLTSLTSVLNAVASSLDFAADFLDTTRKNIPDEQGKLIDGKSIVETSGDYETDQTRAQLKSLLEQRANEVMNQVFLPGGKSADAAMPIFPLPKPVTQGLPDPTGKTNPGGPSGGPSPKIGGPGPGPATSPQLAALKQQQNTLADQRKAMEDAQKKAEADAKQRAAEIAKQTANAERQAALRTAQQQAQQAQQAAQQGLQKGLEAAQQAAQQGLQAAQQAAQQGLQAANAAGLPASLAGLGKELSKGMPKAAGPGPGPAKTGALSAGPSLAKDGSKLFPRASVSGTAATAAMAGRGLGAVAGQPGTPGGMGPAGAGAQGGQNQNRKRPAYLESTEHLEEALGDAPIASKPVAD
ncbi:hypothetical protein [Nocardia goodfellowii]|uniref:F0F1-type ATP synthase membrane subunit b/b n=1 Tax=Nocardia goodfellowii TaxID=882446 RepID=A0ABS4QDC9_9NOCA|nr:hypothetical protein [Nocardia goodfellowii]MBP2189697.1 F0F1-type ATP synthase membrane subunit b/b' [Nocardia goodfellowii]